MAENNLTQEDIALKMGVAVSTVGDWLKGATPHAPKLKRLTDYLDSLNMGTNEMEFSDEAVRRHTVGYSANKVSKKQIQQPSKPEAVTLNQATIDAIARRVAELLRETATPRKSDKLTTALRKEDEATLNPRHANTATTHR